MAKSRYQQPKTVLIFNGSRVLIAIVRSLHKAAEFTGCNLQAISHCCTGRCIQTGGYYFRHIHPKIEIEVNDLDNLTVQQYDELCGYAGRKYHPIRSMKKYKTEIDEYKSNPKENGTKKKPPTI